MYGYHDNTPNAKEKKRRKQQERQERQKRTEKSKRRPNAQASSQVAPKPASRSVEPTQGSKETASKKPAPKARSPIDQFAIQKRSIKSKVGTEQIQEEDSMHSEEATRQADLDSKLSI